MKTILKIKWEELFKLAMVILMLVAMSKHNITSLSNLLLELAFYLPFILVFTEVIKTIRIGLKNGKNIFE